MISKLDSGLYIIKDTDAYVHASSISNTELWHFRLGHASYLVLKTFEIVQG